MNIAAKYVKGNVVHRGRFPGGARWPLLLVDDVRVSVNFVVPDIQLAPDEVAIKDYSECEGVLGELFRVGAVASPHRYIASGHVMIPVCKLLV